MKKILTVSGIDPSTRKLAIVSTRRDDRWTPEIDILWLPHEEGDEIRAGTAGHLFAEWALNRTDEDGRPPRLYLEAPVMGGGKFGPRIGPTIAQSLVSGAILSAAYETECKITLVNNQTWKSRAMGSGNISKAEVGLRMQKRWKRLHKAAQHYADRDKTEEDVIDAGGINLFGWKNTFMFEKLWEKHHGSK